MTRIESNITDLRTDVGEVFAFLSDLRNHRKLMPSEVVNWQGDQDTCSYTITGTGSVHLKVSERVRDRKVVLEPNGRIPFPFTVEWIAQQTGSGCRVQVIMEAELNAVLKMMAVRPLTNFLNMQIDALSKIFNERERA